LTPDQPLASISGRLISLPARPIRTGSKWLVPLEFINRALAPVYDVRLDLRRQSHLLIVGDLRVPRLGIRHDLTPTGARVAIDTVPRAAATVTQEGNRLLVRFDADALDVTIPALQSPGLIDGIRLGDGVTLALDLGARFAAYKTATEPLDGGARLVIEVTGRQVETVAPPPSSPAPVATDLPSFGRPQTPLGTVVLDAGHGGTDAGARGAKGAVEKDLTLAVARKLKAALEMRLGVRVIMTRDDDRHVSLDDRSSLANNNKANLFVSLHANASLKPEVQGATVYVADFSDGDRARARMAPAHLPVFGGGVRDIELVPWDLAQLGFLPRSAEAARLIGAQLAGHAPVTEPAVSSAPFRVLEAANMPAVLIEMGYLTNAGQETQLASIEFQTTLAQAIVEGIVRFRDYLGGVGGEP
jgi:N-acetylmuramoyl-L-alanine amidase